MGLTCFLILLIAMFPARAGFALFSPDSVDGFGISGSLWNGNAKIINIGGQQLRNTEWNIAMSQLLLGRLGGDDEGQRIVIDIAASQGDGHAGPLIDRDRAWVGLRRIIAEAQTVANKGVRDHDIGRQHATILERFE